MRFAIGLALAAALGAAACKKSGPVSGAAPGSALASGSSVTTGSAGVAASAGSGGSAAAGSADAPFDAKAALDAALKTNGIAEKNVTKRATGPHSAWALVVSKSRDDGFYVTEYTILRAAREGVAELAIPTHEGGTGPSLDKDVDTFDVRDLDGDGHDECLAVLTWQRDFNFPYGKGCKTCEYGEGENGKQLFVIADKAGGLAVAFTHLVEYDTLSQPEAATDPDPPGAEKVAYDWKVDGTPPVVTLTRTDNVLNKKRPKELLDPATDPLLSAGSGESVPLVLK